MIQWEAVTAFKLRETSSRCTIRTARAPVDLSHYTVAFEFELLSSMYACEPALNRRID